MLLAAVLAAATEVVLRLLEVEGRAPDGYFVAVAALVPALALGLLVRLVTRMAVTARSLIRELKRFDEEMSGQRPEVDEDAHRERARASAHARPFVQGLPPFLAGLALQFAVTEALALYCALRETDARAMALGLGVEVAALLVYVLLFNAMLARLAARRDKAAA
jgi:hypothetical protein